MAVGFKVRVNTKVYAVKDEQRWEPDAVEVHITTKDVVYGAEDLGIDPTGILRHIPGPSSVSTAGEWARMGYYGFRLPQNRRGYKLMLVSKRDVDVA